MKITITLFFIAIAFFAIYKIKMYGAKGISKHWFAGAFAIKLLLAGLMIFMYSRTPKIKKNADIFRYYNDAQVIYKSFKTQPSAFFKVMFEYKTDSPELKPIYQKMHNWDYSYGSRFYSSNKLIIRLIALFSIITFGSYGAMVVLILFLSFTGLFWIFRFFSSKIKHRNILIFILIFLTPSVAFWSSGILKESLLIFFIGLVLNCGNFALKGRKPIPRTIIVLLALFFIFQIKAIILLLLLPSLMAYLWNHYLPNQRTIIPYFILYFVGFSIASGSENFMDKGLFNILKDKQIGFIEIGHQYNANSMISPILFDANSISIAANAPIALINSLFRPAFWEANNLQSYASATESFMVIISVLLIIIYPNKEIYHKNLLLFSFSFALSYLIIIGLTTPILGAVSRYRIISLIFLEMSLIQLINLDKIEEALHIKRNN